MQNHFNKLNTPIRSLPVHSSLRSQAHRFLEAGFKGVEGCDLNTFLYAVMEDDKRVSAFNMELFDEYEELGAFLNHYFILSARNEEGTARLRPREDGWQYINWKKDTLLNGNITPRVGAHASMAADCDSDLTVDIIDDLKSLPRKFMAAAHIAEGILIHGGLSNTTRESSSFIFMNTSFSIDYISLKHPSARMCHTITSIAGGCAVLIGGRQAPGIALSDTWLWCNGWEKGHSIPGGGVYRHAAAHIGKDEILVFGGRRDGGRVSSDWLLYSKAEGWRTLRYREDSPALWGASLAWGEDGGILIGGMDQHGNCLGDVYSVYLHDDTITLKKWNISNFCRCLTRRYGAKVIEWSPHQYLVIGGADARHFLPWSEQFVVLSSLDGTVCTMNIEVPKASEPWLVGHDIGIFEKGNSILIFGGGGVCFSFGSFWNDNVFVLHHRRTSVPREWKISKVLPQLPTSVTKFSPSTQRESKHIRRVKLETPQQWRDILQASKVCILEGLDFGSCVRKWTPDYLKSKVGADKDVVIHSTNEGAMNFLTKNFKYSSSTFGAFIDTVFKDPTQKVYLRALSEDAKNKPARLEEDFPGLVNDFAIPEILRQENGIREDRVFSTILRIGGVGTSMWLHYDVTPNEGMLIGGHGQYPHAGSRRERTSRLSPFDGERAGYPIRRVIISNTRYIRIRRTQRCLSGDTQARRCSIYSTTLAACHKTVDSKCRCECLLEELPR
jgi:tRNA wybutosine-synthesizing protein 4